PGLMATLACKLHYMNSRNTAGLFAPMRLKLALDRFKLDGLLALNEAHTEMDVILFGTEQAMASNAQTVLNAVMDTVALHLGNNRDLRCIVLCSECARIGDMRRERVVLHPVVSSADSQEYRCDK